MKSIGAALLAGAIAVTMYSAIGAPAKGDETISGEWRASYSESRDVFRFEARVHTATSNSNWSESNSLSEFRARHVCDDQLGKRDVHCDVNREAGTATLDGHFNGDSGSGTFTFRCKEDFRHTMSGLGYSGISLDECFEFARHNIESSYVQQVKSTSLGHIALDQFVNLSVHQVPIDYLKTMVNSVSGNPGA